MATDINELIDGRNSSYGDAWAKTGEVLQVIAPDVQHLLDTYPRAYLPFVTIICKAIRACATPEHKDHWADIAGYATLVLNDLERADKTPLGVQHENR
jgi:hypothetical protein